MNRSPISNGILAILITVADIAPAPARLSAADLAICSLVTAEDASSIFGNAAKKTRDPSGCGWDDAANKKSLNVAYVRVPSVFAGARSETATSGKNQDEAGLGGPAFSTIPSEYHGNRIALYCLKGSTVLILDLQADGAAGRLAQMRDVMRKVVAKL